MNRAKEFFLVFSFGAVIYSLIEILFRGYTHWTMAVTGGIAFSVIYLINFSMKKYNFFVRCLAGCIAITFIEFVAGCIINIMFHLNVWDYSDKRFNILGQICPQFMIAWFFLCIPAFFISNIIKRKAIKQ